MSIMITEGFAYLGARGDIAIFNPQVERENEYTTSHVALENGPHDKFEAVKAGWTVSSMNRLNNLDNLPFSSRLYSSLPWYKVFSFAKLSNIKFPRVLIINLTQENITNQWNQHSR